MRTRMLLAVSIVFLMISVYLPIANADTEYIIPSDSAIDLNPIVTGSISRGFVYETPNDICIASDGTIFVVAVYPYWQSMRGASPASFIAWHSNGSVRWAQRFSTSDRALIGVETNGTHVFVTGSVGTLFFLAKYSFEGELVWNLTRSMGNITYGLEMGTRLYLLEDGTIIASGISNDYSDSSIEYFVGAFNQEGQFLWGETFESNPSICCDSDSVYLLKNETLQKRDSDGTIVWERGWTGGFPNVVQSDILYSTQIQVEGLLPLTSVDVTTQNLTNGEVLWTENFRLCDSNHEVYNQTGMEFKVMNDGSMLILLGANEILGWYLFHINKDGSLASEVNRINMTMNYHTQLEVDNDGLVYLAGLSNDYNITVEVFDSNQFVSITSNTYTTSEGGGGDVPLTDIPFIEAIAVGLIAFDIVLIIFLKKKTSG